MTETITEKEIALENQRQINKQFYKKLAENENVIKELTAKLELNFVTKSKEGKLTVSSTINQNNSFLIGLNDSNVSALDNKNNNNRLIFLENDQKS